ncbi:MAG TPA: hypothetical protein VFR22_00215 [Nocardioidaceae bacterium]|nr:hypothetical protein [Nocardioidaceae bacterium]
MGTTGRSIRSLILAGVIASGGLTLAACDDDPQPVSIEDHLYGPGARLGHGVKVPEGAVRVGPTITIIEDRDKSVRQISMLQIDGDPDATIKTMLEDLDRLLPDADVDTSQARSRCWLDDTDKWIQQCRLVVGGHNPRGDPVMVDITVTPTARPDGQPMPGTTGRPEARVLVHTDMLGQPGTNLQRPPDFLYAADDQASARWPIAADGDHTVERPDTLPGTDDWSVAPGGTLIGSVLSDPRYYMVAVDKDENLEAVATSYASSVPTEGFMGETVATVGGRVTTSYNIESVEGGPGPHLWSVERPDTDYLFLRYWPPPDQLRGPLQLPP